MKGDVFKVPLSGGFHSYGQVLAINLSALFDEVFDVDVEIERVLSSRLLKVDRVGPNSPKWRIVGRAPLLDNLRGPFSFWSRDASFPELRVQTWRDERGWTERFVRTEDEVLGMSPNGVRFWDSVENELCEHFGLPVEQRGTGVVGETFADAGPFDNDTAGDWLAALPEDGVQAVVEQAFEAAMAAKDDFIDVDIGRECVAAAALLAIRVAGFKLRGAWPRALSVASGNWYRAKGVATIAAQALAALEVVRGPNSEVALLWDSEGTGKSPWHEEVGRVEKALRRKVKKQ